MKKLLLYLLVITCLAFSFSVKAQTPDANAPVISFEKDTVDYGSILHSADGNRVIKFSNTGKAPLIIKDAHASCQCTVPSWPHEPIQPGTSAEIKVHYNTGIIGHFAKMITITSNATQSTKVVWIIGNVLPPGSGTAAPASGGK